MNKKKIIITSFIVLVLVCINGYTYYTERKKIHADLQVSEVVVNLEINDNANQSNLFAPQNIKPLVVKDTSITLQWTFPQARIILSKESPESHGIISGFRVYRDDFDYTVIPANEFTFTDNKLFPDEEYRYKIAALTADNKIQGKISADVKVRTKKSELQPIVSTKKKFKSYLAEGDSITVGQRAVVGQGWVDQFSQQIDKEDNFVLHNKAISGSTVQDLQKRITDEIEESNPDLVTIAVGLNDLIADYQWKTTVEAVDSIIIELKPSENRTVILASIYHTKAALNDTNLMNKTEAWNKSFRDLAYAHKIPFADIHTAMVNSSSNILDDQLHPNTAGHTLISKEILDILYQ